MKILIIIGRLLVIPVYLILFGNLLSPGFLPGIWYLLALLVPLIYGPLLWICIHYSKKNNSVYPILILVLLYGLPVLYLIFLWVKSDMASRKRAENKAAENAPIMAQINSASKDYICANDNSPLGKKDFKFISVDEAGSKILWMISNDVVKDYRIQTIGSIPENGQITITVPQNRAYYDECRDASGQNIFEARNAIKVNK
jgi:hypothetical protein